MLVNTNMSSLGSSNKQQIYKSQRELSWEEDLLGAPSCKNDTGESLAEALAAAIERYKERMLKGLNALTEEEIEELIEEFKLKYKPVNGTQEELEDFINKLARFAALLREIARLEPNEMLITSSASKTENKNDSFGNLMQQMITNPMRQFSSNSGQNEQIKASQIDTAAKLAMRYENMLSSSIPKERR